MNQPSTVPDIFATQPQATNRWPALWIARDDDAPPPHVTLYRLEIELADPWSGHLHVSGDEWFEFFLDGKLLVRGPGISSPRRWLYETVECSMEPGAHTLLARVFAPGNQLRPEPVMSVQPGFLCCPDPQDKLLATFATGVAPWTWQDATDGWTFQAPGICDQQGTACGPFVQVLPAVGNWPPTGQAGLPWQRRLSSRPALIGAREVSDGVLFPNSALHPTGNTITGLKVRVVDQGTCHEAYGEEIPNSFTEPWKQWLQGSPMEIPAGERRRILIDADNYVLGFVHLDIESAPGAAIAMTWTERLMLSVENGACWGGEVPRHRIDGLHVVGPRDEWTVAEAGQWSITTPWKRCGRYLEIILEAGPAGNLRVGGFRIEDALAPSPLLPPFSCDSQLLEGIQPPCRRVLETGLSSAFCDCPYFEQVQWVGDMYPILLCHLAAGRDEAVYRQAIQLVADGAMGQNPTQARFPIRPEQGNSVILSFSLWYVAMVHDYALWRGHPDFVRTLLPTLRRNVDFFLARQRDDGLCVSPPGWNYFDWALGWDNGCPPSDALGVSGVLNLLIALACRKLAALEDWLDEPELASRWNRRGEVISQACHETLWDESRGCYRDSPGLENFSEHAQTLALLDPGLPEDRENRILKALAASETQDFCTRPGQLVALKPFFSHHLFEALVHRGCLDAVWRRLSAWQCLIDLDLRTTPESMPGTRSDCHGWSAHPLFHTIASFAGIRPSSFGFSSVHIRPQLGPLGRITTSVWTHRGEIHVSGKSRNGVCTMRVKLPNGLAGTFTAPGQPEVGFKGDKSFEWTTSTDTQMNPLRTM